MAWRVVDWAARYENNRSRELKHLTWFPCPNSFDQDPWAAMVEAGPDVVAAWIAVLISASRSPVRGDLLKPDGRPHDARSLARSSQIPAESFAKCIDIAIREAVLECVNPAEGCGIPAGRCDNPAEGCGISGVELELELNRTEGNKKKNPECTASAKPAAAPVAVWGKGAIRYVVESATWEGITPADMTAWAAAYPAVDIPRQLAAAAAWVRANPKQGRKANYGRFIAGWLSRDQDRGGRAASGGGRNNGHPTQRRTLADTNRERDAATGYANDPLPDLGFNLRRPSA